MSSRIVGVISKEESNAIFKLFILFICWAAIFCFCAILVTIALGYCFPSYIEGILGQLSDEELLKINSANSFDDYVIELWNCLPLWITISVLFLSLVIASVLPRRILIIFTIILLGIQAIFWLPDSNFGMDILHLIKR